ncbi:MAG: hypothetical protein WD295_03295, partial [Bacteroidota bacterium]
CKHSALLDRPGTAATKIAETGKIDRSTAIDYAQNKIFTIGQAIYHTGWDDLGRVVAKTKISNGVHSITVSFEKLGERKLIENLVADPGVDVPQPLPSHA